MSTQPLTVPNLIHGVSQQVDYMRYQTQCSEQVNYMASAVHGLSKRPPTINVAKLFNSGEITNTNSFFHSIYRDSEEQYMVSVTGGINPSLKIFDLEGNEQTIVNGSDVAISASDLTYLQTVTPRTSLKAVTIADYTFLINKDITTAMDSAVTSSRDPEALVFIKTISNTGTYQLTLYDEVTGGSPDYDVTATAGTTTKQGDIIDDLVAALDAAGADTVYTYESDGALMHIKKADGSDFRAELEVSYTESGFVFKDKVQNFNLLPEQGYVGFKVKVVGDPDDTDVEYYTEYKASDDLITTGFSTGYWQETVADGIEYLIDSDTVPHVLISRGTDFQFKPAEWGEREVGDDDTNPNPSFIGDTLRGIFFFKNRLGLLSGENVIMSEVGEYFNFFRSSVLNLLDSDPIDVGSTSNRISLLNYGVQSSNKAILFSEQSQFSLEGGEVLSPAEVSMTPISEASNIPTAEPILVGKSIFFGYEIGSYSGLKEFFVPDDSQIFKPVDASTHVPKYMAGKIQKMAGCESESTIFIKTDGFDSGIYVYKYLIKGDEKVQSAFFKLDFENDIEVLDVFTIKTKVYLVLNRGDGTYLEYMDIDPGLKDTYSEFITRLDRRISESDCSSISYSAITNSTTITLPYIPDSGSTLQVVTSSDASVTRGLLVPNVSYSGTVVTIEGGDYSSLPLYIGQQYTANIDLTKPVLKAQTNEGIGFRASVRPIVRYGNLSYDNSALFKVRVTPKYRNTYTYTFSSRNVSTYSVIIGEGLDLVDGVFRFPVYTKANDLSASIINDSPFPSNLINLEWEITPTSHTG